jgi:23S rRNA (uracil1939-C5)-methyltransferase
MAPRRKDARTQQLADLTVERIGAQGDGIAAFEGEPVFLPFTVPGDRVRALLGTKRGGGREGRVIERLFSGPGRADPPCRHFGSCGGCSLQHFEPAFYRDLKLATLRTALERVGIDPGVIEPLRLVPPARRRARLGLRRPRDLRLSPHIGFRQRFRHDLVDIAECLVLEPPLLAVIGELRPCLPRLLSPGGNAEMTLTATDSGIDLLIEAAGPPSLKALEACAQLAAQSDLARVVWRAPSDEIPVVERRPVRVLLSGTAVSFPPGAFLQASRTAETILVEEVLAGAGALRPVLDLFSGLGTFAFALARTGRVHAVEGEPRMAAAVAEATAGGHQISVERRDLMRDPVPPACLSRYAAAVFDPPRAGAASQVEALAASALDTVIAVSCNPATFARDAATLVAGDFSLERLTPVDQFVWTPHLEIVAIFRR